MDYSQSMSNIESIKQFIRLFKESSYLFFDFNDLRNFKVIAVDSVHDLPPLRTPKYQQNLPFAIMYANNAGEDFLTYEDALVCFDYSLTLEYISLSEIKPDFFNPDVKQKLLNQFSSLCVQIKK